MLVLFLALLPKSNLELGGEKKKVFSNSVEWISRILVQESPGNRHNEYWPKMFICMYLWSCLFSSRAQHTFVKMWVGSQNSEQARGSGVGPLSVSGNFYASVNLCLIALAWVSGNGKPISNVGKYRMHPRPAFKCQQCGWAVGRECRYGFQHNCPL